MERGSGITPGPFLHAAFPNRTCELSPHPALHKPRWMVALLSWCWARAREWLSPGVGIG